MPGRSHSDCLMCLVLEDALSVHLLTSSYTTALFSIHNPMHISKLYSAGVRDAGVKRWFDTAYTSVGNYL